MDIWAVVESFGLIPDSPRMFLHKERAFNEVLDIIQETGYGLDQWVTDTVWLIDDADITDEIDEWSDDRKRTFIRDTVESGVVVCGDKYEIRMSFVTVNEARA